MFTAALVLAAGLGAGSGLAPQERRIADWVAAHAEEAVTLLERAVDINSGTMNHAGVRAVGQLFAAELDAIGFETRWIELPPELRRAGHLFAERRGSHGRRVLLIGHLDTVFEADSPFQKFRRVGDVGYGPGTEDMKGGDVVVIQALKALHAAGALEQTRIVVAFTGDEEDAGDPLAVARRDLIEAGRASDVALAFEAGVRDLSTATVARRGVSGWRLEVKARPAHSSGIFEDAVGAGAVFETARILGALYAQLRGERYLTFNPGVVLGGTTVDYDAALKRGSAFGKSNVIAESAVVEGDLRFISAEQESRARERMRALAALSLPGAKAELSFEDGYPALSPKPGNYAVLEQLSQVSRDLGLPAVEALDPGERGAGDVSFVGELVEGALDGLGPLGRGGHTVDERVELSSLTPQTQRAAILIYRLTR